jgi:hypothetical protein
LVTPNWTSIPGNPSTASYDPPVLSGTTQFRRYTISTVGTLSCESPATTPVTIIVQTVPTAGAIAADQTICSGGDPAAFTSTTDGTGDGTISYRWERAVSPFSSWTTISGATGSTYDAPSGLTQTTQYRRVTLSTLNSVTCESAPTAPVTVTVQSVPTAGAIAADQTICNGGDPVAFTSTTNGTGDGTITYRWESRVGSGSWNAISGESTPTYDVPAGLTQTTQYRRITISTLNGVACESVPTATITVTVQVVPTAGAIAANQTICMGGNPAAFTSTAIGTGSGTISYRWESNTDLTTPSWSVISGVTTATYDAPAGLTQTTQYRRITLSTLNSVICESVPTTPVTVTVQSEPTAGAIAADQTICSGGDPAAFTSTTDGTGDGTISYRWERAVSPFSSWTTISGATGSTYDAPSGLTQTTQYRRVTLSTLNSVTCESAPTAPVTVTVQSVPTAGAIAADQTICNGGDPVAFTSTTNGTGDGTITYRWESRVGSGSWNAISGESTPTYDVPAGLTQTTQYRRITISTLNGVACESVPTATITVTVQVVPTAGAIAANQTICMGGNPAAFTSTAIGTGSGTISYRWESNTDLTTPSWSVISGVTTATYDAPAGLTQTTQYRRITLSTLNSVICESVPTTPVTVTVQSEPTAGAIAADQTICNGGDPAAFTSTTDGTGDGAITYRWERAVSPFSTWTTISGASNATYDAPAGLTATTRYRRFTISTLNGVPCESPATAPVEVTVQSVPTAGAIAADQTFCITGDPAEFTSTTLGTGSGTITYRWESRVGTGSWNVISGAEGATYDAPAGLTQTTQYRRTTLSTVNGVICESVPTTPITVTIQSEPTAGVIGSDQTICIGGNPAAFSSTTAGTGDGTITYRWESNTNFSTPNWTVISGATVATYDVPGGLAQSTQYRRITLSTLNSVTCESAPTAPVTVTVQSLPTAGSIAVDEAICIGGDPTAFTSTAAGTGDGTITYLWESRVGSGSWTVISGADGPTYDAPSGLTQTTQYRRTTLSTLNGVTCQSAPTSPVTVTIIPNNTVTPVNPNPSLCLNEVTPVIITHTTTGATGIAPQSASVNYNLPNGVTASWNAGVLTIEGTPTEFGVFNYSIPFIGGCGTVSATGTITVENPTYPIIAINVVNPPVGSTPPFVSTFTVFSNELTTGTYTVNYSITGINGGPDQTISVNVTTPGEFTFNSLPYSNEGTTILTINSIQKTTDLCPYSPPNNNTVPYGVSCSNEYLRAGGDAEFYVPAGITEIDIDVFGDGVGGNTASQTMTVIPGGVIFIVFDGTNVFATEVPPSQPMATRLAQAIVRTTGPNGRIVINYNCTPPTPCIGAGDVFQYTDSQGYTVIRVTGDCSTWTWSAPDGLDEFEVLVVGGGGGGGFGEAAGGGGGGAVVYRQFSGITMNGLPGLQNATFSVTPGSQGLGATSSSQKGGDGGDSFFAGTSFTFLGTNVFTNISAEGGGGGGSSSSSSDTRQGASGASGGGGAAFGSNGSLGGVAMNGNAGGNGNGQSFGSSGAGGGGASGAGASGSHSGGGNTMIGGIGGSGESRTISGQAVIYGAGGGGTSSGGITNIPGNGGGAYSGPSGVQIYAGGSGNNNGTGQAATTYGSGGGAGRLGGSAGFQGVVYIRYPNFRILPIEFLDFDVEYNPAAEAADLTWTTAKEWENDHFEIERSVNNVKSWENIGELDGAGYSNDPLEYSFQDTKLPLSGGTIFYRIKQVSFSGDANYSITKAIQVDAKPGVDTWRVYPNPTTGYPFDIELLNPSSYKDGPIYIRVITATGKFETFRFDTLTGIGLRFSDWFKTQAAGLYTFEISWNNQKEYHKVILRR